MDTPSVRVESRLDRWWFELEAPEDELAGADPALWRWVRRREQLLVELADNTSARVAFRLLWRG